MKITKEFEVEMAHYVPNATSQRCSHSTHGHSYKILVTLASNSLDNAMMVYDFGLMKGTIKSFIDSMDHALMMYDQCSVEYKRFFKEHNERWIEVPFIPSAEMMSVFIFRGVKNILSHTKTMNGEGSVSVHSVKVYETRTGSAECSNEDVEMFWIDDWEVTYSNGIIDDWTKELKSILIDGEIVENPAAPKQVLVQTTKYAWEKTLKKIHEHYEDK